MQGADILDVGVENGWWIYRVRERVCVRLYPWAMGNEKRATNIS